jgi:(p)ppGpp synthase/HD superfamily hydrolase
LAAKTVLNAPAGLQENDDMDDHDTRLFPLRSRFEEALLLASRLHANQKRKDKDLPYISHLLAVTALVLEDGGDEDEAIAALLHDAVEDQGGLRTLAEIRRRFGERVAVIVEGCSDSTISPKPPWQERKQAYLEHLRTASADIRRVSLADKLHNARTILADLQMDGEAVWSRFNGGKAGSLWYYRSLLEIFQQGQMSYMLLEFTRVMAEIDRWVAGDLA